METFQGDDAGPAQLHPGDLGWNMRDGAASAAKVLRLWSHNGDPIAIGMLDTDTDASVIRLAVSPTVGDDETIATRIADDLDGRDLLPQEPASAEVRVWLRVAAGPARSRVDRRGWLGLLHIRSLAPHSQPSSAESRG